MTNLDIFSLDINSTVKSALKKIDSNKTGIAIIVDDSNRVLATLSDGDIRRFLIGGGSIHDHIKNCINTNFIKGRSLDDREKLLKKLDRGVSAIPIVDADNMLKDIITRDYFPIREKKSFYIRSKSPSRISFGGGGSDLSYYFNENKAAVINSSINLYSHVLLIPNNKKSIKIYSDDLRIEKKYASLSELIQDDDSTLKLINCIIEILKPDFGFELYIKSDFPVGSGLGGSASVVSAVIGAFNHNNSSKLDSYEMAELAFQAERIKLNIAGGWQDQYAAVFGGFNFIEFNNKKNIVHPLKINKETIFELEESLVLVNTNLSHKSGDIHKDQKKELSKSKIKDFMKENVMLSYQIRDCLLKNKLDDFGQLLNKGWLLKKNFSEKISNETLNKYYEIAIKNGAIGGKILGAGSGGHFLFYSNHRNKFSLINALQNEGLTPSNFSFEPEGLTTCQQNY